MFLYKNFSYLNPTLINAVVNFAPVTAYLKSQAHAVCVCVCVCVYNVSMLLSNNNNIGGSDYKNYIMLFIFFFSLTP